MPSDRQSVATSSRCSASPMASTRARRSSGGQIAGYGLDAELRESLAQAGRHMVGGGDEAAEHDRVGALGNQRLEQLSDSFELWIGGLGQALGLFTRAAERPVLFEP